MMEFIIYFKILFGQKVVLFLLNYIELFFVIFIMIVFELIDRKEWYVVSFIYSRLKVVGDCVLVSVYFEFILGYMVLFCKYCCRK